jgi:HlyD family secretion protein
VNQQNKADENTSAEGRAISGSAVVKQGLHPAASVGKLSPPVSLEHARKPRRWLRIGGVLLVILFAVLGAGFYWWKQHQSQLPAGISWGNGRLGGDEIDIDTKFAGRIAELRADLGDMVTAGQVVAVMDTRDIQQTFEKAEAQVKAAQRAIEEANENLVQQQTQQTLAAQELDRAQTLLKQGYATQELFDQQKQALDGANAGLIAAKERVEEAKRALEALQHDVGLYKVNIADNSLVAPRAGRIQYRIMNIGEVLPAGGRVFTMLDIGYVYMDIYLPPLEAGKVRIGTDARILLDAYPNTPIPAQVFFVASEAFSAAGVVCDDLVGIDASTALLSHVRRTTSGCRQTYSTVDILVACAHGAEVPTPL